MIVTKDDLYKIKGENSIEKYIRGRVNNPKVFFNYIVDNNPPKIDWYNRFMSVDLPIVNRKFV